MKALVAITDLTRMQGVKVCLAGYMPDYTCIRPILLRSGLTERWLQATERAIIRPFSVVEFDLLENTPEPPHTEDWTISPVYRVRKLMEMERRKALMERILDRSVESIFGATIHNDQGWFLRAGEGQRSLGTITPRQVESVSFAFKGDRWDYRISFVDDVGARYRLAVTDLAFRYYLDSARAGGVPPNKAAASLTESLQQAQVFIRVGLARGWEKYPERCHLQITGVHTFPDYLGGQCYADLAPAVSTSEGLYGEEKIPF